MSDRGGQDGNPQKNATTGDPDKILTALQEDGASEPGGQRHSGTELAVALDYPRAEPAMRLVEKLRGVPGGERLLFKVGLELFTAGGPDLVRELVHLRQRVFLDLKLHDIPRTVARAARQAAVLHAELLTIHLAGGREMARAVAQELSEIPSLRPKIIGVSVLTSFDDVRWAEVTRALTGHAVGVGASVAGLVGQALVWGVDGVVCSAHELGWIRENHPGTFTVVPGIRPAGTDPGDQARIMTPGQASRAGADLIVVGRPITEAPEPEVVVRSILDELALASNSGRDRPSPLLPGASR
jgi:orotidine-5'-phosphate decarboxylase